MSQKYQKNSVLSNAKGFTLLEVLFAVAIAGVGFLALGLMQGGSTQGNWIGSRISQATFLAQQQIEAVKTASLDSVDMANNPKGTILPGPALETNLDETGNPALGGIFTRQTVIQSNTEFSRTVTVNVTWTSGGAWNSQLANRTVTLTSTTRGDGN